MTEKRVIIDKRTLSFSGLFVLKELYKIMDDWLKDHGYKKNEIDAREYVTKDGKEIAMFMEPNRKVTDYAKYKIRIDFSAAKVKTAELNKKGRKLKVNSGDVYFIFWADLETDFENRWEQQASYFFIRTLVDKFVYQFYMKGFEDGLKKDVEDLIGTIKAYLNMER